MTREHSDKRGEDTTLVSSASSGELADACATIQSVRMAENNGGALAALLAYRFRVREEALDTKGIPPDMLLVNKELFAKMLLPPSSTAATPVAWMSPDKYHPEIIETTARKATADDWRVRGWEVIPLYRAPSASGSAWVEPGEFDYKVPAQSLTLEAGERGYIYHRPTGKWLVVEPPQREQSDIGGQQR